WTGTQFGLNVSTVEKGRTVWRKQPIPGADVILALTMAPDGSLWIGADPGGLWRLDTASASPQRMGLAEGLDGIQNMTVDREKRLWVGTRRGLYRSRDSVDMANKIAFDRLDVPSTASVSGLAPETFRLITIGQKGDVWAAGERGLAHFADGRW